MKNIVITTNELVQMHNKKPVTTSLKVAEVFGKMHKNVLHDIESLEIPEDFNRLNFQPINYTDKQGRTQKAYEITKNGFSLLAFGYNGAKAMQFKVAYIKAFDQMEQALMQQRKSREKEYFKRKAFLYKQKHEIETQNKNIWVSFNNSANGKQLQENKQTLIDIKNQIAEMYRKAFGYTHNLFAFIENY